MRVPPFMQERFLAPARAVLLQGLSPNRLTGSVVLGAWVGLIPSPATATLLGSALAALLRLNQAAVQVVLQALGLFQMLVFLPFIRAGEWLFQEPPLPLSPSQFVDMVTGDPFGTIQTLWTSIWHAVAVWGLLALPVGAVLFVVLRPGVTALLARSAVGRAAQAREQAARDQAGGLGG